MMELIVMQDNMLVLQRTVKFNWEPSSQFGHVVGNEMISGIFCS